MPSSQRARRAPVTPSSSQGNQLLCWAGAAGEGGWDGKKGVGRQETGQDQGWLFAEVPRASGSMHNRKWRFRLIKCETT